MKKKQVNRLAQVGKPYYISSVKLDVRTADILRKAVKTTGLTVRVLLHACLETQLPQIIARAKHITRIHDEVPNETDGRHRGRAEENDDSRYRRARSEIRRQDGERAARVVFPTPNYEAIEAVESPQDALTEPPF